MQIFRHGFGVISTFWKEVLKKNYFNQNCNPNNLIERLEKTFQGFRKNKQYYFIVVYIHRQADKYTFKL